MASRKRISLELSGALRRLTNRIIHGDTALWRRDRAKIDLLAQRLPMIGSAKIDKISRIYWLIEDCKRYGTLPFAGLARAGFIAVQLLQSFVAAGVIDEQEHATFMASVDTVGSRIGHDFAQLTKAEFLYAMVTCGPGPMTSFRPATTMRPTCISTGPDRARIHRHNRASRSRSSSCAASNSCSKSINSISTC